MCNPTETPLCILQNSSTAQTAASQSDHTSQSTSRKQFQQKLNIMTLMEEDLLQDCLY